MLMIFQWSEIEKGRKSGAERYRKIGRVDRHSPDIHRRIALAEFNTLSAVVIDVTNLLHVY